MNRKIAFRAWNTQVKKMIDLQKITPLAMDASLLSLGAKGLFIPFDEQMILMQYTGLTDKNGKDIYEDDIVRTYPYPYPEPPYHPDQRSRLYAVQFSDFEGAWILKDERAIEYCPALFPGGIKSQMDRYLEIIGNIYENSNLLKEVKTDD